MKQIVDVYSRGVDLIQKLDWLPVLLARISMGSIFILAGWGKLHNLPKVTEFFTELGIPFPEFNAGLVGFTEFGCGLLVLFGLFTRLASLPLIATMIVAIITAKRSDLTTFTDLLGFEEFIYITVFVWFLVGGAGSIALDNLLCRKFKRN